MLWLQSATTDVLEQNEAYTGAGRVIVAALFHKYSLVSSNDTGAK